ncbi:MAG: matrixin family metalloprotease [Polyangia bacterium]|jgi:MYXO-CTERM domain-containing protein
MKTSTVALPFFALALASSPAFGYVLVGTSDGAMVHWDTSALSVGLDPTMPSASVSSADAAQALDAALATWTDAAGGKLTLSPAEADARPDTIVLVRFHQDDWPYQANLLAYTQLYAHQVSGQITSAVIEVNERDHHFSVDGDRGRYDLQAVLTHELGHLIGLGHSLDPQASMHSGTAPGDAHQRNLDDDDRAGLTAIEAMQSMGAAGGCSFSPASPGSSGALVMMILFGLLGLAARRRRPSGC